MATINGIYVWVEKESMGRPVKVPQHPVEKGLPITDLVVKEAKSLSISGKIVDTKNMKADAIISKLEELEYNGSLINYSGREVVSNFMIVDFNADKDNKIHGGANFDMELLEVRISKSAYDPAKQKKAEAAKNASNPTLEVGAIVVFKGGPVYVSSDATKAAATRGRSTCKITNINNKSWSKHDYHLVSTDGKKVYGWVDKENIEGTGTSSGTNKTNTSANNNTGVQQVQKAKTEAKPQADNGLFTKTGELTEQKIVGTPDDFLGKIIWIKGKGYYTEQSATIRPRSQPAQIIPNVAFPESKVFYLKDDAKLIKIGLYARYVFPVGTPIYRAK